MAKTPLCKMCSTRSRNVGSLNPWAKREKITYILFPNGLRVDKKKNHDRNGVVTADKALNNFAFVRKWHYIDCLITELGIDNSLGNPTYISTKSQNLLIFLNWRKEERKMKTNFKDQKEYCQKLFYFGES